MKTYELYLILKLLLSVLLLFNIFANFQAREKLKLTKVDVVATLLTLAPADAPTASSWLDAMATVHSTPAQSAMQLV